MITIIGCKPALNRFIIQITAEMIGIVATHFWRVAVAKFNQTKMENPA